MHTAYRMNVNSTSSTWNRSTRSYRPLKIIEIKNKSLFNRNTVKKKKKKIILQNKVFAWEILIEKPSRLTDLKNKEKLMKFDGTKNFTHSKYNTER